MTAPDLLYGEVEEDLRANVQRLLREECDWTRVLQRCESDQPYDLELWARLSGELGLTGLLIPETCGGAGASPRELAVLAEELGRSVAPVPFLGSAVLATATLLACHEHGQEASEATTVADVERLLTELAGGAVATVAVPLSTAPSATFLDSVTARDGLLTGTVRAVVDLAFADAAVVPAVDADGPALYLVETSAAGFTTRPHTPLDLTRRIATAELSGVSGRRIAGANTAPRALRHGLRTAAGILASEQVGLAQQCLDSTVEYVRTRYQFARPIGSFQAVKHRLADLWAAINTGRAAARNAADALCAPGGEPDIAVAVAQAYCGDLVTTAAEESLQLHGGIGMTWEHPAHLYLGRAKSSQLSFGGSETHRHTIAAEAGIPAPAAMPKP